MHRDIKPENVLVCQGEAGGFTAKLCDFGWSVPLGPERRTFCGTYEYMAPEVFEGKLHDRRVDIWALGILLFELLHGFSPFKAAVPMDIHKNILAGKIPYGPQVSSMARDLVGKLLQVDPRARPSIEQILSHPYIK